MEVRKFTNEEKQKFVDYKELVEETTGERLLRKRFIASQDSVNKCVAWLAANDLNLSPEEVRLIATDVERDCLWRPTISKEERKLNNREYGTGKGVEAIDTRNENCRKKYLKELELSEDYLQYIKGELWQTRREQYLNERCKYHDQYVCEMCGKKHQTMVTMNVHHNEYTILDGTEHDTQLLGCCATRCHTLADVARYLNRGKVLRTHLRDLAINLFNSVLGKCPHGDDPSECEACFRESDEAYDASREDRYYGR